MGAGDQQARDSETAIADADNKAILGDGSAGNDYIDVDGGFWNKVAGDAQAIAGRIAKAFGKNDAKPGDYNDAGNDTIKAGAGHHPIPGGSQAVAGGSATPEQEHHAGTEGAEEHKT